MDGTVTFMLHNAVLSVACGQNSFIDVSIRFISLSSSVGIISCLIVVVARKMHAKRL